LRHGSISSFAMSCVVGLFEDGEDVLLAQDQVLLVVELHLGAGVLPEEDLVAGLDVEGDLLALVGHLAVADGDDLTLLGLLLRGVRDDDAALFHFLLFESLDEDTVMQRTTLHRFLYLLRVVCCPWTRCFATAGCRSGRLSLLLSISTQ